MKEFLEKVDFEKNPQTTKKHALFPSRQRVKTYMHSYTVLVVDLRSKALCFYAPKGVLGGI